MMLPIDTGRSTGAIVFSYKCTATSAPPDRVTVCLELARWSSREQLDSPDLERRRVANGPDRDPERARVDAFLDQRPDPFRDVEHALFLIVSGVGRLGERAARRDVEEREACCRRPRN